MHTYVYLINFILFCTVPWCLDGPASIPNTIKTEVVKNRTISYSCSDGYESSDSLQQSVIVTCSSGDEDNEPWRWNDTSIYGTFNCTPGTIYPLEYLLPVDLDQNVAILHNVNKATDIDLLIWKSQH